MRKLQLFVLALVAGMFSMTAQNAEIGPFSPAPQNTNPEALFDLLFTLDVGSTGSTTVNGLAGVIFFGGEYWISEWQTDVIHRVADDGTFIASFTIPGVTGTRSFTTDGTNIYIGTAGLQIFEIDPGTMMVTNTINITTGSSAEARMCTYDETLDGGSGGFWIGDFGSDIASVDMSGNELSVIPAATHGTTIYGGTIDNVSPGGPFLWIHDQSGTAPSRDFITQINPATGVPTGVIYDFTTDGFGAGSTDVLAGGLTVSSDVDGSVDYALLGLCQCTPSNLVFAIELVGSAGVEDNSLADLSLFPNPTNGSTVNIQTALQGDKQVTVFDVLGKQVINTVVSNNELSIAGLNSGVYIVRVVQNGLTATKKLVVR